MIHHPPGPPSPLSKELLSFPPRILLARACLEAGRGEGYSSPSINSATRLSGTFSRSSYVARRSASSVIGENDTSAVRPARAIPRYDAPHERLRRPLSPAFPENRPHRVHRRAE